MSYLIKNNLQTLIETVAINRIQILYSNELLEEVERVLNYPHLLKYKVDIKKAILFIKLIGVYVELTYPIKNYIPDDDYDSYIIALALQHNAGFVTSGDKHILSQKAILEKRYRKLTILTKVQFEGIFYN